MNNKWGTFIFVTIIISIFLILKIDTQVIGIDISSPKTYDLGCHLKENDIEFKEKCTFYKQNRKIILLVGDSHAAQWFPGLEIYAKENDYKIINYTKSSCPAFGKFYKNQTKVELYCKLYQSKLIDFVNTNPKDSIILLSAFYNRSELLDSNYKLKTIEMLAKEFIELIPNKKRIYWLQDTPVPNFDIVTCLQNNRENPSKCNFIDRKMWFENRFEELLVSNHFNLIETRKIICPNGFCSATIKNHNRWRDQSHLSVPASKLLYKLFRNIN